MILTKDKKEMWAVVYDCDIDENLLANHPDPPQFIEEECKQFEEGIKRTVAKAGKEIERIERVDLGTQYSCTTEGEPLSVRRIRLIGHLK